MTNGNIERLLVEIKESLERELGQVRGEMRHQHSEIKDRLSAIETSLTRQSGLIAAGTRALARTEEWAGSADVRFTALEERVRRLEQKGGGE